MANQMRLVDEPVKRPGRALKAGIFTLFFIIILLMAIGGVAFIAELNNLKTELLNARRELTGAKDRIARLERRVDETNSAQSRPQSRDRPSEVVTNVGEESAGRPTLELSREEIQLLRDYIKVPPAPLGVTPGISVGAAVPVGVLTPLPAQISDKIPKLLGARFMTDRNGAIVIVRRGSRQADAIVNPN